MMTGFLACWLFLPACLAQNQAGPPTPESRAIAFLAREVPRWPRQKSCYSCHNNGDAARALYLAVRAGFAVPETALTETNRWLAEPARWDHNGGEGARSDKRLARLVFTATLATAADVGSVKEPAARALAAARLADDQGPDGSWPLEGEDSVSSPATYGRALATFMARQALASIQPERFQAAIARGSVALESGDRDRHRCLGEPAGLRQRPVPRSRRATGPRIGTLAPGPRRRRRLGTARAVTLRVIRYGPRFAGPRRMPELGSR